MTSACPLCTPVDESLIWSDQYFRVVAVNDPRHPGFVCVICQEHVREFSDLPTAQRLALMELVARIESLMRSALSPDKINLASLGNQVPHLHWHIIARWSDDPCFPESIWSAPKREPVESAWVVRHQQAAQFLQTLGKALRQH